MCCRSSVQAPVLQRSAGGKFWCACWLCGVEESWVAKWDGGVAMRRTAFVMHTWSWEGDGFCPMCSAGVVTQQWRLDDTTDKKGLSTCARPIKQMLLHGPHSSSSSSTKAMRNARRAVNPSFPRWNSGNAYLPDAGAFSAHVVFLELNMRCK